jgi:DNA/RNA endonuclease G (NUC1)
MCETQWVPHIETNREKGNCTEKSSVGSECNLICVPGYQEAAARPVCTQGADNTADWNPTLDCVRDSCGSADAHGFYKFSVNVNSIFSPLRENGETNLYYVAFDSNRFLPIYSATYVSRISYMERLNRTDWFEPYTCLELARKQANDKDFEMTRAQIQRMVKLKQKSWDRGHLSSQHFFRWSYKSARTSNFYVNIAPQDGFSNQNPWKVLEDQIKCFLKKRNGVVITGVSPTTIDITDSGLEVPSFFWKLVCFNDIKYGKVVVGFIGDNSLTNRANLTQKTQKISSTLQFRSQSDIMGLLNVNRSPRSYASVYSTMWADVHKSLLLKANFKNNAASFDISSCRFANDATNINDIQVNCVF